MVKFTLIFSIAFSIWFFYTCPKFISAVDTDNLQDICPTNTTRQTVFINGFPCKNPSLITASDFKNSLLNHAGNTDHFLRSSVTIVTASEFPGLNTLGLSVARTDLDVDGLVLPHSHPRASEILFVSTGNVVAGFVDTQKHLFQRFLRRGDVFVVPRGMLHYSLNSGFDVATVFSVLNSQNPGMLNIADALFAPNDSEAMEMLKKRLINLSKLEVDQVGNVTFFEF
ncbi:unnamed protein product [Ilex paraguariensis]|uniref:Germin-like protein n=1 Tax=Ilex paraguariensis TaxID=185542 RepID=A0ABC8T1F4_9AQUA